MKCELCHEHAAEVAITVLRNGAEEELYVCKGCAKKERLSRKKKSQRTRKVSGLPPGVSMSITEVSGNEAPPFIEALMDAVMGDLKKAKEEVEKELERVKGLNSDEDTYRSVSLEGVPEECLFRGRLHLEGLRLIGELEPVQRALSALKMRLKGVEADGIRDVAHIYEVEVEKRGGEGQGGGEGWERAKRVLDDLVTQEQNARRRLVGDLGRVFADALGRSLAVLKNCRLVTPSEVLDMLSPLRLGAREDLLDGITLCEIEDLAKDFDNMNEDDMTSAERDRADAERADEMNARFEDVVLNERAEEILG